MFSTCMQQGSIATDVTDDEMLVLVEKNIEKGNIGRAIQLLEKVKNHIEINDPRYSLIRKQIDQLKKKQIKQLGP